jgi:hypothetical protein
LALKAMVLTTKKRFGHHSNNKPERKDNGRQVETSKSSWAKLKH